MSKFGFCGSCGNEFDQIYDKCSKCGKETYSQFSIRKELTFSLILFIFAGFVAYIDPKGFEKIYYKFFIALILLSPASLWARYTWLYKKIKTTKCLKCGKKLKSESHYCPCCGNNLNT